MQINDLWVKSFSSPIATGELSMERQKARRGRPKKEKQLGERVQLSLRVTPGLKEKLDQAAAQSGRSLSQEDGTADRARVRAAGIRAGHAGKHLWP